MADKPRSRKAPGKKAIIRAVATSTAMETGKSIDALEKQLHRRNPKYRNLTLAN